MPFHTAHGEVDLEVVGHALIVGTRRKSWFPLTHFSGLLLLISVKIFQQFRFFRGKRFEDAQHVRRFHRLCVIYRAAIARLTSI
jgi:hypothetical protein